MIYVLFPTLPEAEPFVALLDGRERLRAGLRPAVSGRLGGTDVTVVVSGVGQANTAQTIAALLTEGPSGLVMLCGCGGAYAGAGLSVGDVAVATEEVYADIGVLTSDGWLGLDDIGLPLVEKSDCRYYSRFPVRPEFVDAAVSVSSAAGLPVVRPGVFLTVCSVTGTSARGEDLYRRFGAVCENMEGAAAAQTAAVYDVPFVELRGISNMAGDRDRAGWDIALACSNCAKVASAFIGRYAKALG